MAIRNTAAFRPVITRTVVSFFLFILLFRLYSHVLPFQLKGPLLTKIDLDPLLWLYKALNIGEVIVANQIASCVFTIFLFASAVLCFAYPLKKLFIIVFTILFNILALTFNLYLTHNTHLLIGMSIILFCFWPAKNDVFELLWDGMRYFICWIYLSSLLWKCINGSFFQHDFGIVSFKANIAWILYENPYSVRSAAYGFFLHHPAIANFGAKLIFIAEGFFVIGFFTKRYDTFLAVLIIGIHSTLWFFSDVLFIELFVFVFCFISPDTWMRLEKNMSGLKMLSATTSLK